MSDRSVLVVDDDVHIRRLVRIYLRGAGFNVSEAATGEEALEAFARDPFDLVLVDLILPYFGGIRLCQKLKGSPHAPKVLVITGDDSPQTRESATESEADGFLAKPFTREQLMDEVERIFG